jgi:hypothetical protein
VIQVRRVGILTNLSVMNPSGLHCLAMEVCGLSDSHMIEPDSVVFNPGVRYLLYNCWTSHYLGILSL